MSLPWEYTNNPNVKGFSVSYKEGKVKVLFRCKKLKADKLLLTTTFIQEGIEVECLESRYKSMLDVNKHVRESIDAWERMDKLGT